MSEIPVVTLETLTRWYHGQGLPPPPELPDWVHWLHDPERQRRVMERLLPGWINEKDDE